MMYFRYKITDLSRKEKLFEVAVMWDIQHLSNELIVHILKFLPCKEALKSMSVVSKSWHEASLKCLEKAVIRGDFFRSWAACKVPMALVEDKIQDNNNNDHLFTLPKSMATKVTNYTQRKSASNSPGSTPSSSPSSSPSRRSHLLSHWSTLQNADNLLSIEQMIGHFRGIRVLELYYSSSVDDNSLDFIVNKSLFRGKLEHITISGCKNVTRHFFSTFTEPNYTLKNVELRNLDFNHNLEDPQLIRCMGLMYLTISHCTGISQNYIKHIISSNSSLRHIKLSTLSSLSSLFFGKSTAAPIVDELNGDELNGDELNGDELNDNGLNGNSIKMQSSCKVTEEQNCYMQHCRLLDTLEIYRCKQFESIGWDHFLEELRHINLSYTNVSDSSIQFVTFHSPNLQELKASGCKNLVRPLLCSSTVQIVEFDRCSGLKAPRFVKCSQLKIVSLSYTSITDADLERMLNNEMDDLPSLEQLNLINCNQLNEPRFSKVSKKLREINMHGSFNISNTHFEPKSPIKKLNMNWTQLDDHSVESLVSKCSELQELYLDTCDMIVNPQIVSPTLETLSFKGAHSLHSPKIKGSKLQFVDFENCSELHDPVIVFDNSNVKDDHESAIETQSINEPQSPITIRGKTQHFFDVNLRGTRFQPEKQSVKRRLFE